MDHPTPPLYEEAPPFICSRRIGTGPTPDEPPVYCGKPATWHIIWTLEGDNSIACDEHADSARANWVFAGMHPYSEVCSMPGSRWVPELDRCVVDEELLGLASSVSVSAPA